MERCDVLIVGAGTAGAYFGWKMALKGFSVILLEKDEREEVGKRLDVFHIDSVKWEEFGIPSPQPGDPDLICVLQEGTSLSPSGNYPKVVQYPFHIMRLTPFLNRMFRLAEDAGARLEFSCTVTELIDDDGRVSGVRTKRNGSQMEFRARLIVDASGKAAVIRTALPPEYGVETFELKPEEQFYVMLRYIQWKNPEDASTIGPVKTPFYPVTCTSVGWTHYKSWVAPSSDPGGAIIGIGATRSYEHAEEVFREFSDRIALPSYEISRFERGRTPYRRPPYSVVGDAFLCLGDSACITKPFSGEGVTAAWTLCTIAVEVSARALESEGPVSREKLWGINVSYFRGQGAKFAGMLATLPGAANTTRKENEYLFRKDVIFSEEDFTDMNRDFEMHLTFGKLLRIAWWILWGLVTGNYSFPNVRAMLRSVVISGKVREHYERFPENPADFEAWVRDAEDLWARVGTME